MLSAIAFDSLFPLGLTFLIDRAIVPQDASMLVSLLGAMAALYVVSSLSNFALDYLVSSVTVWVLNDMRLRMFTHLQGLPASYYARPQMGQVVTHFNNDLDAISYALTSGILMGVQYLLELLFSLVVLFLLDWRIGLVAGLLLPLFAVASKPLAGRATELSARAREAEAGIAGTVQESIQAQSIARAFGLDQWAVAQFGQQLARFVPIGIAAEFLQWLAYRLTYVGQYLIQLLVIAVGAYEAFRGAISVGALAGAAALLYNVGSSLSFVGSAFADLIPGAASLERIERFLSEKSDVVDAPDAVPLPRFQREIRFECVSFAYDGADHPQALREVSFALDAGKLVAVVGPSGAGKSTMLNLLLRFYDPSEGTVLLDGQDLRCVTLDSLRAQMAIVFQESLLFNLLVRENIRLGRSGATDAEVEEAARAAEVHEDILALPEGYETLVGERGGHLSGGQRQRIALARALVRNPAILLLDEATSSLDTEMELAIFATLRKLAGRCTILFVTHRLAPLATADRIVVAHRGQVVEQGSHAELLSCKGLYYRLQKRQGGFFLRENCRHLGARAAHQRGNRRARVLSATPLQPEGQRIEQ